MIFPTIHLNGTSKQSLLDQTLDAGRAVQAAIKALENASPNGRDYYPQGADAIKLAIDEHAARVNKLKEVFDDLTTLAIRISDS